MYLGRETEFVWPKKRAMVTFSLCLNIKSATRLLMATAFEPTLKMAASPSSYNETSSRVADTTGSPLTQGECNPTHFVSIFCFTSGERAPQWLNRQYFRNSPFHWC